MARAIAVLLLTACATTKGAGDDDGPRSSVDVLLRNAVELKLTEAQKADFQAIDDKRESKADRLRIDLQQQYLDLTSGDNANYNSNRGSRAGVQGYRAQVQVVRMKLRELDKKALAVAEAMLDDGQKTAARACLDRYRLERVATVQEDGE